MSARLQNVADTSPTTCEWLFRTKQYTDWLDDRRLPVHHGFFWIKGKPGTGKSTIMKKTVDWIETERSDQLRISYFFNARSAHPLEKSIIGLYRSIIHQLLTVYTNLHQPFVSMFQSKIDEDLKVHDAWTEIELQNFLTRNVAALPALMLFIDALDEGNDLEVAAMVTYLEELTSRATAANVPLRICLSSRHYPHIVVRHGLTIVLEAEPGHAQDVQLFIDNILPKVDNQILKDLRTKIFDRSQGIFLWVVLVLPMLMHVHRQGKSIKAMHNALDQVPNGINELFASILSRDLEDIDECLVLLRWVLYALGPLHYNALFTALRETHRSPDPDDVSNLSLDDVQRYILNCSRGLVEITQEHESKTDDLLDTGRHDYEGSSTTSSFSTEQKRVSAEMLGESARNVQLIHQSLREYSIDTIQYPEQLAHIKQHTSSSPTFEAESCHADIATHCLKYLMRLSDGVQDAKVDEEDIAQHWPLAEYAAKFWWQHLRASGSSCSRRFVELASTFLSGEYLASLRSVQLDDVDLNCAIGFAITTLYPRDLEGGIDQGLYYAAMMNLPLVISDLLSQKPDLQMQIGYMGTAVHAAAYHGHDNVVRMLLDAGANPANHNSFHGSALDIAAFKGFESVVRTLLVAGAKVNSGGGSRYTALTAACSHDHREIVSLLLAAGADVHALDRTGQSALMIAARTGHEELVRILLNARANVNTGDVYSLNALQAAAYKGREDVVRVLLAAGAELSPEQGDSALIHAASAGNTTISMLLLESGASINDTRDDGRTALVVAASKGHCDTVRALLKAKADVNDRDLRQRTALMWACYYGHTQVAKILLEAGADITATDTRDKTALQLAIGEASRVHFNAENTIKLLLDHKMDAPYDRRTFLGNGLCTAAGHLNEAEALKAAALLLAYGADPLFVRKSPSPTVSPIDIAQQSDHPGLVDLLRKAVVDMAPSIDSGTKPVPDTAATRTTALAETAHPHSFNNMNRTTLPNNIPNKPVELLYEAEEKEASGSAGYVVESNTRALPEAVEDEFSSSPTLKAHGKASLWRRTRDKLKDKVRKGSASGNNR